MGGKIQEIWKEMCKNALYEQRKDYLVNEDTKIYNLTRVTTFKANFYKPR